MNHNLSSAAKELFEHSVSFNSEDEANMFLDVLRKLYSVQTEWELVNSRANGSIVTWSAQCSVA